MPWRSGLTLEQQLSCFSEAAVWGQAARGPGTADPAAWGPAPAWVYEMGLAEWSSSHGVCAGAATWGRGPQGACTPWAVARRAPCEQAALRRACTQTRLTPGSCVCLGSGSGAF